MRESNVVITQKRFIESWANKVPLSAISDEYEKYGLKNNLIDSIWYIQNDSDTTFYIVKWNYYDIDKKWSDLAKTIFLNYCGGYVDKYQNITSRISSLKTFLGDMKRFFNGLDVYIDCRYLSELSIEQLGDVLRSISLNYNGTPKAAVTCNCLLKVVHKIKVLYDEGIISDGFLFDFPENDIEYFYRDFIESYDIEYAYWVKGGSYGGIPISIAMFLLAHCIQYFDDNRTKLALKYFELMRKGLLSEKFLNSYWPYRKNKNINDLLSFDKWKYIDDAKLFHNELNAVVDEKYKNYFFKTRGELNNYVRDVYDAGVLTICILSGYRIIELRHLLPSHLYKENGAGDWIVRSEMLDASEQISEELAIESKNIKTNKGIGTIRAITGDAALIIDTLINLHEVDKIKNDFPVFQNEYMSNQRDEIKSVPYNTILKKIKRGYKNFLIQHDKSFKDELDDVSPHNFRHTWVDVALRCFLPEKDQSILTEEIRHHLRHQYGSTWTRKYMDGKFTPVHMRELEEQYLSDLINRIDSAESSEFFGPMVVRIKKLIRDKADFIGLDEIEFKEEFIAGMRDDLVHLVGHPWGLCVLMKDTETQAKCYNKETQLPHFEESSCFENCIRCTHRISHTSQKEDLMRYVLAHEDFIENYPIKSNSFMKVSVEAAKVGRQVIKEMNDE